MCKLNNLELRECRLRQRQIWVYIIWLSATDVTITHQTLSVSLSTIRGIKEAPTSYA